MLKQRRFQGVSVSVINDYENRSFQERNRNVNRSSDRSGYPSRGSKGGCLGRIRGWMQYKDGVPNIGIDEKGIGIMQVTDYDPTDLEEVEKLKTDIEYNIKRGLEILNEQI